VSRLTFTTAREVTSTDEMQQLDGLGIASRLWATVWEIVTGFTCPSVARHWHGPHHLGPWVADD